MTLRAGEVLVLVGENGAGKSTLMKILAGAQTADAGTISIDGREVHIDWPRGAEQLGIGMIYQEFNLVPQLTAAQNISLGAEPVRVRFPRRTRGARAARNGCSAKLGLEIPLDIPGFTACRRVSSSSSRSRKRSLATRASS